MKVLDFVGALDADFFTGVPDSQLKALCGFLMETYGIDPEHHEIGEYKAIRGSKSDDDDYNPATYRDYELPTYSGGSIGFRCVKNISHVK